MSANTESQVIEPYIFFNGRCEEAMEFYRKALGANEPGSVAGVCPRPSFFPYLYVDETDRSLIS